MCRGHVSHRQWPLVQDNGNHVFVQFTPTIPHCSMATLIGLCLRVKLHRSLPARFKIDVKIYPGTHASEVDSRFWFQAARLSCLWLTRGPRGCASQSTAERQGACSGGA